MGALLTFLLLTLTTLTAFGLELEQAKELAVKNYPKVKALEEELKGERFREETARRKRLGELDLIGNYSTYNRNYMLTPLSHLPSPLNPPPFDSKKFTYGVSLSLPLYLGGVIGREVELSRVKQELLRSSLKLTKWQVSLNTALLFLEALAVKEEIRATKEYIESLKTLYRSTEAGVKAGKLAEVDLMKVSYSLKEAQARLEKLEESYRALKVALETFVGREVKELKKPKTAYSPRRWSSEELFKKALKRNSRVREAQEKLKLTEAERKLTEAKYGVKITLQGSLLRNYGFDSGENEAYGQASLNLSFPIFTGGRKKLELLEKERKRAAALYEKEEVERELKREIARVVAQLNSIQAEIEAEKEGLKLAKEVERVEELKYLSGKGDINHLLLAKANRFKSEAKLNSAYYRWLEGVERLKALLEVKDEQ